MIDLSENLIARPGNVLLPSWLASALVQSCGRGPAMNFNQTLFPKEQSDSGKYGFPLGLLPGDLELMPFVLAEWLQQIESAQNRANEKDSAGTIRLNVDAVALRQRLPREFSERIESLCERLFGLRVLHGGSGAAEPFFEHESIESLGSGSYVGTLTLRSGMLPQLLGGGAQAMPAIVVPRRLWDELSALERGWLIVVEAAARWKFSWVREDGCVEIEMMLPADEPLADSLKPLATLGRKLVDHGWLAAALDDAPVLFEPHLGASSLRLMWVLHPSRAVLPASIQEVSVPEVRVPQIKNPEPRTEVVHDGLLSKMRLVAAEELQKIRTGSSGQYSQLKQRYLDSLDLQGRKLIRNIEQMLAPELFEEHLRHGLVRYMIEHPSAWQSAASGKPAH